MSYRLLIAILTIVAALVIPAASALAQDAAPAADKAECAGCEPGADCSGCEGCEEGCEGCDAKDCGEGCDVDAGDCGEGCGGCGGGEVAVGKTCWVSVEGMTCGNCAMKVAMAINSFEGVASATIDRKAGEITIVCKPGCCEDGCCEAICAKITEAGFKASLVPTTVRWFYVYGMTDTCCDATIIEQAMMTVKGVRAVALRSDEAAVVFDTRTNIKQVMEAITALNSPESGTDYSTEMITESIVLDVENMTEECEEMIANALSSCPDVADVACSAAMGKVIVTVARGAGCIDTLKAKIKECGYSANAN